MPKIFSVFAGSFKPPHKGHLYIVKKMLDLRKTGYVYIFISKKERKPCLDLTGEKSKKIWEIYIKTLPEKDQERVRLILSKLVSPTQTAYGFVKRVAKKGDTVYLVKSAKNANNTRFSSFDTLMKNNKVIFHKLILPGFESLNSTDMRNAVYNRKKKDFEYFLPNKLTSSKKNSIWNFLKKHCEKK